jgi:hypothetical protein
MVGSAQDVAIKDSCGITRDRLGEEAPRGGDKLASAMCRLSYNGGRHTWFHPTERAVESGQRSHEVELTLEERRARRLPKTASDIAHDLNEMVEQEFSGVLTLRDRIQDGLNRRAFNHPIQRNASHDRWCCLLGKWTKLGWENHGTSLSERTDPARVLQIRFGKRGYGN